MAAPFLGQYEYNITNKRAATKQRSLANQQSALLGQLRGKRNIADIREQGLEGFQPFAASFGERGLATPNVASGIQRKGLERYAADLQKNVGAAEIGLQEDLNRIALDEAASQNELEQYIADQNRQKQNEILQTALSLKDLGSY
jgi:hypothetical protein